jgi:hypothetical protein
MAAGPQDPPRHAGHVVRRLLRRNITIDAETARLAAAAVQAALQPAAPSPPPRRRPRPAASRCSDLAAEHVVRTDFRTVCGQFPEVNRPHHA